MDGSTNITFLTPSTTEELKQYKDLIRFFLRLIPKRFAEDVERRFHEEWAGNLTIVFVGSMPYGIFYLDVFKKTVELHGMTRPDAFWFFMPESAELPFRKRRLIGKRRSLVLLQNIIHRIFNAVFFGLNKQQVIVKVPKGSKEVLGFVRQYRFRGLENTDKGRKVYKLTKERYVQEFKEFIEE